MKKTCATNRADRNLVELAGPLPPVLVPPLLLLRPRAPAWEIVCTALLPCVGPWLDMEAAVAGPALSRFFTRQSRFPPAVSCVPYRPGHFVLACGLRTHTPAFPPLESQPGDSIVIVCGEPEDFQQASKTFAGDGSPGGRGGARGGIGGGGISRILNVSRLEVWSQGCNVAFPTWRDVSLFSGVSHVLLSQPL